MKKLASVCLIMVFATMTVFAQNPPANEQQPSLDNGTIESQFDYMIKKSNSYEDYKVIKKHWLYKMKSHVLDSLKEVHNELQQTRQTLGSQVQEIEDLKADLNKSNESLTQVVEEKNSMTLLGIPMQKSTYNNIVWSIVGLLLAGMLFFIFKFKRSNAITIDTKKAHATTQEEFEAFKTRAREREIKIKRQLQDEINKRLG
ncbi:hypothetical protein [Pontibacter sp. G13]|uniref:hypothetical protein n=1 Tax=Pontibacter sp. G13 TaxID=3074898 RepID=UPI00288B1E99|nr:hypothetical protein [Pontibacter sp. G13]WNJ15945.1 hypothetical protein RJD25_13860 [Pontibacter sp. G13]